MSEQQKRSIAERLRDKFRLIIYKDSSFEEIWYIRLTRINIWILAVSQVIARINEGYGIVDHVGVRMSRTRSS